MSVHFNACACVVGLSEIFNSTNIDPHSVLLVLALQLMTSAVSFQTPAKVTLSKTNMGSTEKDWLKNPSSDYSSGSLERLREKIGQLKMVGAMSATQKSFEHHRPLDTSTLEHHFVGELHARRPTLNALVEKDTKSNLDQDSQGKCPVAGESPQNVSPREQEVKSSRESSVERPMEIIQRDSRNFLISSLYGKFILVPVAATYV